MMGLKVFNIDDKIAFIERLATDLRKSGQRQSRDYSLLSTIAKDLRARRDFPRNNTLGSLEREIGTVIASKNDAGYDHGRLIHLGHMIVSRWPVISQALECFGEESAE
jgi:hypothetical protein